MHLLTLAYVRYFFLLAILQNLPEDVHTRAGFDSNARSHSLLVDESDQLLWACLAVNVFLGTGGGRARDGGFVVKAVEVAPRLLKLLDPFLRLGDHHMAVERAFAKRSGRRLHVGADLGDHRGAKGQVGDEVTVHNVHCAAGIRSGQCGLLGWVCCVPCSQSAPSDMVSEHALPRAPKSADRMDGAMMAGGDISMLNLAETRVIVKSVGSRLEKF